MGGRHSRTLRVEIAQCQKSEQACRAPRWHFRLRAHRGTPIPNTIQPSTSTSSRPFRALSGDTMAAEKASVWVKNRGTRKPSVSMLTTRNFFASEGKAPRP
jgi:hypothetical protein